MNSPYLIIDRSGNAVDINSTEPPTCHDHYRTCHGCPDRVAEPRCHTTCEGYKARQAETERRNAEQRLNGSAYIPDEEFSKRLRDIQAAKDRKNRR